jgi:cytochrome c biogenesis protein CcdA
VIPPLLVILIYLEGILACFSPCGLIVIPLYLGFLTAYERKPWRALAAGVAFTLGFALISALVGVVAGAIGLVLPPLVITYAILGVILIVCGVVFISSLHQYACKYTPIQKFSRYSGIVGAFILGFSYGFVGIACVTPIIAGIFVIIALYGNIVIGAALLFLFGLGYGTPLIIASPLIANGHQLAGEKYETVSLWLGRVAGVLLIIIGIDLLLPLFGFHTIIFRFLTGGIGP